MLRGGICLIERLLRLRRGYVRIHICGGAYERFLNLCANNGVALWDLCPAPKGYEANLYAADFFKLSPFSKKCRTRVRIKRKYGLPFYVNRHRKRKAFALGIVFCGFFIFLLSQFIWNISIEGNLSISRQTLMEYLSEDQITYGTRKSHIDCKQLAADIRNRFPDIIWVSVKMEGTGLYLNVQENTDLNLYEKRSYEASDLVADADGTVESIITRSGTPLVSKGDTVKKGDILVSGEMEITDDAGEVASRVYTAADADIYVKTDIQYNDILQMNYRAAEYTGRKRYGGYVKIGGKYLGIDGGTGSFETSDIFCTEKQAHILKDFYLPFSAGYIVAKEYRYLTKTYRPSEAQKIAEERLQKFLSENEEKGVQIFQNNVKINISAAICRTSGTLTVIKKAGARRSVKMTQVPQEGKNE